MMEGLRTWRDPAFVPFGPTTRARQLFAAVLVMAGAVPVAVIAARSTAEQPTLYLVVLAIGIIGTLGWLVDGRRYVGAGVGALGLGIALTVLRATTLDTYFVLFPLIGISVFAVSKINPAATSGTAGLLVYVGLAVRGIGHGESFLPKPLTFAAIMVLWGGLQLRQILRAGPPARAAAPAVAVPSSS